MLLRRSSSSEVRKSENVEESAFRGRRASLFPTLMTRNDGTAKSGGSGLLRQRSRLSWSKTVKTACEARVISCYTPTS